MKIFLVTKFREDLDVSWANAVGRAIVFSFLAVIETVLLFVLCLLFFCIIRTQSRRVSKNPDYYNYIWFSR